ncbi:hypothetical protein [Robiginitalea aurantiaca]|uniref:Uncharacterized protein n=1 Tax=Robiginitalea aurantiaca TaxID=3056915 RepID=A0ABT7WBH9_9FLAO|nr:hypothetical protein [Robiginitalea aurantiaca]MDM9630274.1 hypothetical protein [Robiginitalea aurantiaca]
MISTKKQFIGILILVIAGFGIGIYLQDLKHRESTEAAWQANRANLERFERIRSHTSEMDGTNWQTMRDSIGQELDSFMILRFRKEMERLNRQKAGS